MKSHTVNGSPEPSELAATQAQLGAAKAYDRSFPAPAAFAPVPWKAGQWVLVRNTFPKRNEASVTRMGVIQADANGFVIESETQDYYSHSIGQTVYARQPTNADEAVDLIRKLVSKDADGNVQVQDFSQPEMAMVKAIMKGVLRQSWNQIAAPGDVSAAAREAVTIPAGTFNGAARLTMTLDLLGSTRQVTTWWHPAVPLHGAVKTVSADGEMVSELLDFGATGAKSAF